MITTLFIWSTVALSYSPGTGHISAIAWAYAGEYATIQHCENAGRQLGLKPELFRCVPTGKK